MASYLVKSTPGARKTRHYDGLIDYALFNSGSVGGYYYSVVTGGYIAGSYRTAVVFDTGDFATKPEEADQSTGMLMLTLKAKIRGSLAIGVLSSAPSTAAQTLYDQLGANEQILGILAAGDLYATINLTTDQVKKAGQYGVRVFPVSEFSENASTTTILTGELGTALIYTPNNPASHGRVSDITPGNYFSIVASEDKEITYTYHHDYGGYAQAYLGVTAENIDTGETVTICKKRAVSVADGAQGSFVIPGGTLTSGKWRITISAAPSASANYYGDSAPFWTEGESVIYTVRENPSASSVSCDGRPIPEVEWESVSQAAYQVRLGDYDSGARAGTGTAFVVPRIFADGAYPAQVRTASSAGTWSDWTETEYVTIQNVEPAGTFTATAVQDGNNIRLNWTAFASAAHYAVFRDGTMIAVLGPEAVQYVDRFGAGGTYEVLAVTSGRYYKSSGQIAGRLQLSADLLSADGGYTWLAGKYTPDQKTQPEDLREDVSFVYYAGREKPIAYRTRQRSRTKSFLYVFRNRIPARTLRALVGSEVIVKTTRGEQIRGVLTDMSWGDARFVSPSFQIRETWGEEDGLEYPT